MILCLLRRDGGEHVVLAALDEEKDIILILGLLNLLNQIVRIFYRFTVDFTDDIAGLNAGFGRRALDCVDVVLASAVSSIAEIFTSRSTVLPLR